MLALLLAHAPLVPFFLAPDALAANLPGVPVPFDVDGQGRWLLAPNLPESLAAAGAKPGWVLVAVDDVPFTTGLDAERQVAEGQARNVRLRFRDESVTPPAPAPKGTKTKAPAAPPPPPPETVVVVRRASMVRVDVTETIPLPTAFMQPPGQWAEDWRGAPTLTDGAGGRWTLDPVAKKWAAASGDITPYALPQVFWSLTESSWVVVRPGDVAVGTVNWATNEYGTSYRARAVGDSVGDHLLRAGPDGIEVANVEWPPGVPTLPTCSASVPETCLASGKQITAELGTRVGAREEALRHFGIACANGVHRGCYESVAIEQPEVAPQVEQCVNQSDVVSCNTIARARYELQPEAPPDLVLGLLEYACELEGSGSLGERLRRVEDVAAGCMLLADAYDGRNMPDLSLLNLDQACVLGRADACERASERRHQAFAARTVRECQDEALPVAASCVELGRLLQNEDHPIQTAELDDFGAFLRGCTLGAADGCLALGDYVDRWGIENPRVVSAEQELQETCRAGEQRACLGAAHLLVRHEPRTEAYAEALVLFNQACQAGLGPACVAGAQQRRIGKARQVAAPTQDAMWVSACDLQSGEGCDGLGDRLVKAKESWGDAFVAWTKACDLGEPHACSELGQLVTKDHDTPWQGEQAAGLYLQRGCDNGDPEGCYWLAEDTLPPKGEPPEPTYVLLERSCEGEYGPGCAELGEVHIERKTSFDDEIAARHFDTACSNGEYESCKTLGLMFLHGKGVERDRQRANELLDRFRLNQQRKYVRLGVNLGIAAAGGGELELVVPIPVGPAISIAGTYSYVPQLGTFMVLLDGDDKPAVSPDYQYIGASVRLYPNHQGRGVFAGGGVQQLTATGGDIGADRVRIGWNARVGIRNDAKFLYSGLEMGFGQYGIIDISNFDEDENGKFPLILPYFAFTFGLAPI